MFQYRFTKRFSSLLVVLRSHEPFICVEAQLCMPGYLANDCQEAIGGSTLLHKRDRPGGLRPSACVGIVLDAQDHDGALGTTLRSAAVASMPSIPGISISISTTSGVRVCASVSASLPVLASPTTCRSGSRWKRTRKACRTTV